MRRVCGGDGDTVNAVRGHNDAPLFSSMDSMTTGSRPGNMAVRLVMASSNVMVRCAMADSWLLAVSAGAVVGDAVVGAAGKCGRASAGGQVRQGGP